MARLGCSLARSPTKATILTFRNMMSVSNRYMPAATSSWLAFAEHNGLNELRSSNAVVPSPEKPNWFAASLELLKSP